MDDLIEKAKTAASRGFLFFAIAILCWFITLVMTVIFGDIKQMTTDPSDPKLLDGTKTIVMDPKACALYWLGYEAIIYVGFICFFIGMVLILRWKSRSVSE